MPSAGLLALVVLVAIHLVAVEQRDPCVDPGALDAVSRLPFSLDRCQDPEALGSVLGRFLTGLGFEDVAVEARGPGRDAVRPSGRGAVLIPLVHPDGRHEGSALARWPAGRPPRPVAEVAHRAAALAALALRRLHHERDTERLASLDHLTGLPNRRSLAGALQRELSAAGARQAALGLVVLDVDHFKEVNDAHGHAVGDQVLVELADGLRRAARGEDLVARVGGEEFVVVLPDLDPATLGEVTERIRLAVAEAVVTRPVTVSAGAACFPTDARDAACLFEVADLALYRAKRAGRDQSQTATRVRSRPGSTPVLDGGTADQGEPGPGSGSR